MEEVVHKCVSDPLSVHAIAAKQVDAHPFTVPMARLVKHEVENN